MIAACPKCGARYRLERERLQAGGVRLRCARCDAVFRVRPPGTPEVAPPAPEAAPEPRREVPTSAAPVTRPAAAARAVSPQPPAPPPAGDVVLVAMPDGELARRTGELLGQRGLRVLFACDGVEAMLEIQRKLPRAIVLAADLPKMYGFQICEVVKRNESLRGTWVVLVGAIHHSERYRRAPNELYGADAYVEGPELPAGLLPLLAQGGIALREAPARAPLPARPPVAAPAPEAIAARRPPEAPPRAEPTRAPAPQRPPPAEPARAPAPQRPPPAEPVRPPRPAAAAPAPRRNDGLDEERAKAERLARIVISDIVLYNEERFAAAAQRGNVLEAMAGDLGEGRQLFEERVDARVRAERDHLKDELLRRAQARGAR
jgi:predicted Zn finger-like uncharacterized protein